MRQCMHRRQLGQRRGSGLKPEVAGETLRAIGGQGRTYTNKVVVLLTDANE